MAFGKKITLLKIKTGTGTKAGIVEESKTIWADVKDMGVVTKMTAETANTKADLQAIVHRSEFDGHTHAEYEGKRYKIEQSGATDNALHIKLILSKGG